MQKKYKVLYLCIAIFHVHFSFEEQLPKWKLFKENEDLNLTCNVTKSATWYFNGVKISNNRIFEHHLVNNDVSVTHSVLKLQNANKDNAGIYNCVNQQRKTVTKYIVQPNGSFVSFCNNYDGPYAVFHDKGFLNISFAIYHHKRKYDSLNLSPSNCLCDGNYMPLVFRYLETKELNYEFVDGFEVERTRFYITMNLTEDYHRYMFHVPCSNVSFDVVGFGNARCVAKSYSQGLQESTTTVPLSYISTGLQESTTTVPLSYISTENVKKPITIGLGEVTDNVSTMTRLGVCILACVILSVLFLASSLIVWRCTREK